MKWYQVVKTINGKAYLYWQRTQRIGGKVKTSNQYIGPATAIFKGGGPGGISFIIKHDGTHMIPSKPDLEHEQIMQEKKTAEQYIFAPTVLDEAERREDERIRYGSLKARKERAAKLLKQAKKMARGRHYINPFLASAKPKKDV